MFTNIKSYFTQVLQSPRRSELLKPAVMSAVSLIVMIVVVEIVKNSLVADPSRIVQLTLASVINGFVFGTVMPPFMYLIETLSNIESGKTHKNLKPMATFMTPIMFVASIAVVIIHPDGAGSFSTMPFAVGAAVSMATMLVMSVVEKRLIKGMGASVSS